MTTSIVIVYQIIWGGEHVSLKKRDKGVRLCFIRIFLYLEQSEGLQKYI